VNWPLSFPVNNRRPSGVHWTCQSSPESFQRRTLAMRTGERSLLIDVCTKWSQTAIEWLIGYAATGKSYSTISLKANSKSSLTPTRCEGFGWIDGWKLGIDLSLLNLTSQQTLSRITHVPPSPNSTVVVHRPSRLELLGASKIPSGSSDSRLVGSLLVDFFYVWCWRIEVALRTPGVWP
jgi:hypothetical protein